MAPDNNIAIKYITEESPLQTETKCDREDWIPKELFPSNNCHLTELDLSHNQLTDLPENLIELTYLKKIDLSYNNFALIPDVFYLGLFRIENLNFSYNKIQDFPAPNCILSLSTLNLSNNKLDLMPSWIWERNCRLKELDLSGNPINMRIYGIMFKTSISTSRLRKLILNNSNFGNTDKQILSRIPDLLYLDIGNADDVKNGLNGWEIPIKELHCKNNLQTLRARNLNLSVIPGEINEFKRLKSIDLGINSLHWLPDSFYNLSTLSVCNLENNTLSYIPTDINKLTNLTKLYLAKNNLASLPEFKLPNLLVLDVFSNNIEYIDESFVEQLNEFDAEKNYFQVPESFRFKTDRLRNRLKLTYRPYGCNEKPLTESEPEFEEEYHGSWASEEDKIVEKINTLNIEWSNCVEEDEVWGDSNYLDDNFIPSIPQIVKPEQHTAVTESTAEERYLELHTIFEDAD